MNQPIRVLVAKPGLDGHDRGALVVAQGLRDQGMEVIYTGLRQTAAQIVATAIEEDVACIGLSSLSGAHMALFPEVVRLLRAQQADDILVIGGGVIPEADVARLKDAGVAEVFTPGSTIARMADFIREHVHLRNWDDGPPIPPLTKRIDHIGIAVSSISDRLAWYVDQLGLHLAEEEIVADQQVKVAFLTAGDMDIELLEPTNPDSPIARFIARRGEGLHHVAFAVADVSAALQQAKAAGVTLIDEQPRRGGRGKWIAFVHPRDTGGVLTEFCQPVEGGTAD